MDWLVFSPEVYGQFIYPSFPLDPASSGQGLFFLYYVWTRFGEWWHLIGNKRCVYEDCGAVQ